MIERTLSIIKPDAVARGLISDILKKFQGGGLKLVATKLTRLTPDRAREFYAVHKERPFFAGLCEYMSSGPILVSVLEGENGNQNRSGGHVFAQSGEERPLLVHGIELASAVRRQTCELGRDEL